MPLVSPPRRGKKVLIGLALALLVLAIAAVAAGPVMSRVEQPRYDVVRREGPFELRSYAAMIAAEVEVQGDREPAIQEGFRLIAAYIFGANEPNTKISMTAPVQQQASLNIAMTAPVTQQASGVKAWLVRFIMPSKWSMASLPRPHDHRVRLTPVLPRRMLVVRFSGLATAGAIERRTSDLRIYATDRAVEVRGAPVLAFYNPPWTLPFFRRNEIMFEVED